MFNLKEQFKEQIDDFTNPSGVWEVAEDIFQRNQQYGKLLFEGAEAAVGQSPKDVVWSLNKVKLYRYRSPRPATVTVPLLMVYALINRAYILDLVPGRSLIEYLVGRGFDVYLLDWGTPGLEDKDLTFGDYITNYIPKAVKRIKRLSKAKEFSILGYCMGGTMSAMYAALYPDDGLKNLILMASPIDFSFHPYYSVWLRNKNFDLDRMVDVLGLIPGNLIDWGNKMLKPVQNFLSSEVNLWSNALDDKFLQSWAPVNKWVNDGPPFPGEVYRQWIRDFYQENKLVKGEVRISGHRVDLGKIKANLLAIGATRDHITLPQQVKPALEYCGSVDKEYFEVDAGHVALTISSRATKKTWPKIAEWLQSHC
ncbi:MAG TPA: class III poly(R)-hydroxyalkanoic acid synthase subunit PhaC [Desulfobacteria bacterium]|nr:class III poly(R)-hydroxyalkanoic acid synthase subunit PhaC [Desulfobacteria bacterium]